MDTNQMVEWLASAIAKAERVEGLPAPSNVSHCWQLPCLTPCLNTDAEGGAALVTFDQDTDAQQALNILATVLPEGVKLKLKGKGAPEWILLWPRVVSDPLGQRGVIGAKWRNGGGSSCIHGGGSGG